MAVLHDLDTLEQHYSSFDYYHTTGYTAPGYMDFPINQVKVHEILCQLSNKNLDHVPSVLDVGCAYGFTVQHLREAGVNAWGVDISDYALSQAPDEIKPFVKKGWAHSLPFADQQFDMVVSFGMMEHMPDGFLDQSIQELERVSKPHQDGHSGLISVTLSTDFDAEGDESHSALKNYDEWKEILPQDFDLWSDMEEVWKWYAAQGYNPSANFTWEHKIYRSVVITDAKRP